MIELGFYRFSSDDRLPVALTGKSPPTAAICWKTRVILWFVDLDRFEEPLEIIREPLAPMTGARTEIPVRDRSAAFVVRRGNSSAGSGIVPGSIAHESSFAYNSSR